MSRLDTIRASLGDLFRSAYSGRLFICLDRKHNVSMPKLISRGIEKANIFVWPENGIEYMYPCDVLGEIFLDGENFDYSKMLLTEEGYVEYGRIRETKDTLSQRVAGMVTARSHFPNAFVELIERMSDTLGVPWRKA